MPYNFLLFLTLLFQAGSSNAATSFHEHLKSEAVTARYQLENKISECKALENREVNYFDFWLQSQTEATRRNMVWDLIQTSRDGCIEQERNHYTVITVRLAALTDSRALLDEWLNTYPEYHHDIKEQISIPREIYQQHLQRLSQSLAFHLPFPPIEALDAIVPNQEDILNKRVREVWLDFPGIPGLHPPR